VLTVPDELITERETLGRELQCILDEKTNPWGITMQSVEVRDVRIPQGLEDAMSRQAQAERERQARIILFVLTGGPHLPAVDKMWGEAQAEVANTRSLSVYNYG
jgi:hypothetical protein